MQLKLHFFIFENYNFAYVMDLYDFNSDVYRFIFKKSKVNFLKQIKNSGIVFKEVLFAENPLTKNTFHMLVYEIDKNKFYIRFKNENVLISLLTVIAEKRLDQMIIQESRLLLINDIESYGEEQYYNDTEMTSVNISALKELLEKFKDIKH